MSNKAIQSELGKVDKLKVNRSISLDEDEAAYAREIGGGNLSKGVQRALKYTKESVSHEQ